MKKKKKSATYGMIFVSIFNSIDFDIKKCIYSLYSIIGPLLNFNYNFHINSTIIA